MPTFSERQTQAAELIKLQIESLENAAQTLPYWEVYRAIIGVSGSTGGGNTGGGNWEGGTVEIVNGTITEDIRLINQPGNYTFNNYFYLYLKIINGDENSVILKKSTNINDNGVPLLTDEYINFEQVSGRKHGNIIVTVAQGGVIRIIGGY